jgi:CheY-like chemotaxis protein
VVALRILIADDNAPVRSALRRALESAGTWEIIEAEDGEEALSKAREFSPNLIILDLAMPVMDGMRASRAIVPILPGVPIIMHTLHYSPRVALEAVKAGARKVVPKADRATILSVVRELLNAEAGGSAAMVASPVPMPTIPVAPSAVASAVPLSPPSDLEPPNTKQGSPPSGGMVREG